MEETKIIGDLICGKNIDLGVGKSIYELLDYYEMNLYGESKEKEIVQEIQDIWKKNQENIKKFKSEINNITSEFEKNSIEFCILAGIPMAERYHNESAFRLQEDIDFWIDEKDLEKAETIMKNCGYAIWNASAKKKHITFIKDGFSGNDLSLNGKCAVKLYRRISDKVFLDIGFSEIRNEIEDYSGYKVLKTEMALFHLIVHAHYYDLHPKVLCDIFMICKNGSVDWKEFFLLVEKFKMQRIVEIVIRVIVTLGKINIPMNEIHHKNDFIIDMYSSEMFWEKIFIRLNKFEMTRLRCYLFDDENYSRVYNRIIADRLERRVSPIRQEFEIRR